MKNIYLANKNSFAVRATPLLWCSLKTYYEENSTKSNEYQWADPWIGDFNTKEQILEQCQKVPPHIFGFSVFVWNEEFFNQVAQEVKKQYPDCLIVYGGPQPNVKYNDNFFNENPWIDIVVPGDAYGEIVFKEILDQYPITDYEKVPYIYYRDSAGQTCFSKIGIEKKSFKWPNNIYKAQEKYLLPFIEEVSIGYLDTSRGCPYKCIYCDWGGGTYTKVNKKPFSVVLDEIEWFGANHIKNLFIHDANFGIYDIDETIAEHIVDIAKKYGYPKSVGIENAKNHIKRTTRIKEIFAEQGLLKNIKISLQNLDDEIKNNVERVDPPIAQQFKNAAYLRSRFPELPINIETIMGLPGDSYQKTLNQIDVFIHNGLAPGRTNIWMLLPGAPAFDPVMREKFQFETIRKMMSTETWSVKTNFTPHSTIFGNAESSWTNKNVESVVGTYSYSKDDFVDMYLVNALAGSNENTNINQSLCKYLYQQHGILPSQIQDFIYRNYIKPGAETNDQIKALFYKGYQAMYNWVYDDNYNQSGIDFHQDFPLRLSHYTYFALVMLTNAKHFYEKLCHQMADRYNDSAIVDLGIYLANGVLDSDYNPDLGRVFTTQHDWLKYFQTGVLTPGPCTYQVDDKTVFLNQTYQDINWHQYPAGSPKQHEQYLYQAVSQIGSNLSKNIKLL